MTLEHKYNILRDLLKDLGSVVVAYSGGMARTFLFKMSIFAKA